MVTWCTSSLLSKMIPPKWIRNERVSQSRHINWVRMCYFLAAVHPTKSSRRLKCAACHCQFWNEYPLLASDTNISRQLARVNGKVDKHYLSLYTNINSLFTNLCQYSMRLQLISVIALNIQNGHHRTNLHLIIKSKDKKFNLILNGTGFWVVSVR